jgi:hypothetical protein
MRVRRSPGALHRNSASARGDASLRAEALIILDFRRHPVGQDRAPM